MEQIDVGVIGSGLSARVFHLPVIGAVPALRLRTVVERRGDEIRRLYPALGVVREVDELLRDAAIGLVVITTPNGSHFELAQKALLADKHVVVEKPFTVTSTQAQQLIDLAQARNRVLSVYHNRRWDGDFLTVQRLLAGGQLGRLVEYESHFDRFRARPRPGSWREQAGEGTGMLYDLGSHLIDQAQVLFGRPRLIGADIRTQRDDASADDSFDLLLHYDGLKVMLKAGMLVRGPSPRFILHGTAGSFVKYGLDPQEDALRRGLVPPAADWGVEPAAQWGRLDTEIGGLHVAGQVETLAGAYPEFYRNVAAAIAGREALAVRPEQARDTIRLIELALASNAERRTLAVDG